MIRYNLVLILLVGIIVYPALAEDQDQVDLSACQLKSLLLLLFAPSEQDPAYQSFAEQLGKQAREVLDRDFLTFHVFENGKGRMAHPPLDSKEASSLRSRFSVMLGQRIVILISKDGEVKLRREIPAEPSEIFSTIDAMPMRQQEIRERAK